MSADRNHMTAHPYSQRFIYISSQFMFSSKINSTLQEKKNLCQKIDNYWHAHAQHISN